MNAIDVDLDDFEVFDVVVTLGCSVCVLIGEIDLSDGYGWLLSGVWSSICVVVLDDGCVLGGELWCVGVLCSN